ncbi:hypothetical protein [Sorangium sp. So ce394]|uniref:hypothetical protein n=1 Tax=Sorangium sp. So ce394 TaxID=3133310 RepID=UPI003F5B578E
MELRFDLWHLAFVSLVAGRAPPNFEVLSEVRLTIEPQRADLLLLRRVGAERKDDQALVLRALWARLGRVAIVEYKSPAESSFRPGDLVRLVTYGGLYETAHLDELPAPGDLTLVLVVASVTPTLRDDLARKGWTLSPLGGGYARIDGPMYTTYLAITDEVTDAERDDYLRLFSRRPAQPGEAARWLKQWMRDTRMKQPDIEELPGYEEMFQKLVEAMPVEKRLAGLAPEQRLAGLAPEQRLAGLAPEQRLAGLAPEQRLAGLAPEQRLAGLAPEQVILALPVEVLRMLPEEHLQSLPPDVQETIKKRLRGTAH